MLFQVVQIVYWLGLSTWFGAVLFVAVAAPIVFRTLKEANPILPTVLSVNLENQHATLLGGTIMGNILSVLLRVEAGCSAAVLLALIFQWFIADRGGQHLLMIVLRSALYVPAMAMVIYDWRVLWPRAWKYRQDFIDHADEPEVANPIKDKLDETQRLSAQVLTFVFLMLLGMILFSATITPAPRVIFGAG